MSVSQAAPARYRPTEFEAAVLALRPATAIFDCDGTLWSGDAGYGFMVWSIEAGLVSRNASDWIDSRYRLYLNGEVSETDMCGEMVQLYAGLQESELRHAAADYFRSHVEAHIFPEMRTLVEKLRAQGADIWAVSSTNNWVVEEGVRRFGISPARVLAAQVKVVEGRITSELVDVPSGDGKSAALRRAGIERPDAVFGNSIHDAAMLHLAKRAFPVNPTPALLEIAADHGWSVFYPSPVLADSKS
ncbi:MAG: haloacid dehalogenase-like hydrolase [Silvibacterium sp.]|nr:haloacid dehalogenase-like hydrolase [Silvibacterium sp.]MBV8438532.1 haloacid dehalogenase-like hydrolase [Silvibacterium sp.]MBV8631837.1 haloacid dehalogenase-like hydrolase [Silvibacterium sp.]